MNHPSSDELLAAEAFPLTSFPELNFSQVSASRSGSESVWRAVLPSGIEVEKKFSFDKNNQNFPLLNLTITFRNPKKEPLPIEDFRIGWSHGLGTIESEKKENERVTRILAYPSPTKEVVKFKAGEERADYRWMGIDNRYYLLAMLPKKGEFSRLITNKSKLNRGEIFLAVDKIVLSPGETKLFELQLYGGQKGYTELKKLGLALEYSVDFGTFGFLGKWALKAMNGLHKVTGNYGWTIILLTCALQVLLFPLSLKSYQSTAAMKKLQPKIQDLQKRYKEDPKRLNQEMLSLYKDKKTNPFGGCVPMILQIPVFWAFFTMLRNSYELRGTPWILWIKDLSQRDPYYVLPIVMGGGMFLQQKVTGNVGGDPTQAKMMSFMPIIFTFMFLNFPSGLVLYWLTNSILSIAIQFWCSKKYA